MTSSLEKTKENSGALGFNDQKGMDLRRAEFGCL